MIAVALSGGVDSAVAAALLCREGRRVIGLTGRLLPRHHPHWSRGCCDTDAAASLCRQLGIEHRIVDLSADFDEHVVRPFVSGYGSGLTPNPCIPCNRDVKFGPLLARALEMGCEKLATGHYAVVERRGERWGLRRGLDREKDQSYMLLALSQEQLARALLPLGAMHKPQVRALADEWSLSCTHRESQDVCFAGGDVAGFLTRRLGASLGPIVDTEGHCLGRHKGLHLYTVGQRRGLGIGGTTAGLYVLAKDPSTNALIVGTREQLCVTEFRVTDVNWVSMPPPPPTVGQPSPLPPEPSHAGRPRHGEGALPQAGRPRHGEGAPPVSCLVELRYRGTPLEAAVTPLPDGDCAVRVCPHEQAVAPGQAAALYDTEGWLLGGGTIAATPL